MSAPHRPFVPPRRSPPPRWRAPAKFARILSVAGARATRNFLILTRPLLHFGFTVFGCLAFTVTGRGGGGSSTNCLALRLWRSLRLWHWLRRSGAGGAWRSGARRSGWRASRTISESRRAGGRGSPAWRRSAWCSATSARARSTPSRRCSTSPAPTRRRGLARRAVADPVDPDHDHRRQIRDLAMRVDNDGEGGILALMSLLGVKAQLGRSSSPSGLFGAALIYGDGAITPAISVLSALEGLEQIAPAPDSLGAAGGRPILFALFAVQPSGRRAIGSAFGPIMLLWFVVIAALGISGILAASGGRHGDQPALWPRLPRAWRDHGLPRARRRVPVRHRGRGALRRHGTFRRETDPARRGRRWCFRRWS